MVVCVQPCSTTSSPADHAPAANTLYACQVLGPRCTPHRSTTIPPQHRLNIAVSNYLSRSQCACVRACGCQSACTPVHPIRIDLALHPAHRSHLAVGSRRTCICTHCACSGAVFGLLNPSFLPLPVGRDGTTSDVAIPAYHGIITSLLRACVRPCVHLSVRA